MVGSAREPLKSEGANPQEQSVEKKRGQVRWGDRGDEREEKWCRNNVY